ncbi:MAG: hypothetical protein EOO28_22715 [Comamonadaceae bacterium]|nr:MAG: hypothetical protein EOO28_22715 [Comamonadaceae bacterium]
MSDSQNSAFGKFVPGFDFLQSLAKGASQSVPQMPNLGNWIAPTISVEELDKRIDELKAVQFWLDQNATALKATIQALEVQKMTLATLKGMNFSLGDVANAFKLKAADTVFSGVQKAAEKAADTAEAISSVAANATAARKKPARKPSAKTAAGPAGVVDPMQWWGSLTQQFQQIAASAVKDAAKQTAMDTTKNMAAGLAKGAMNTATGLAKAATQTVAAGARSAAAPARKPARKTTRRAR